jgi:hypothetical protein
VHQEQPRTENGAGFSYMSRGARHGLPEESGTGSVDEGRGAAAPQGGGGATGAWFRLRPPMQRGSEQAPAIEAEGCEL